MSQHLPLFRKLCVNVNTQTLAERGKAKVAHNEAKAAAKERDREHARALERMREKHKLSLEREAAEIDSKRMEQLRSEAAAARGRQGKGCSWRGKG